MNTIYKIKIITLLVLITVISGCEDYLDIVPEKTQELDLLYDREQQAFKALATCYSYLPKNDDLYGTHVLLTDELTTPSGQALNSKKVMQGEQNVNNPFLGYWIGYNGGQYQHSLYKAINDCNLFLENIYGVPDMEEEEKSIWSAEVKFLKAYYHFLLVRDYGPIPIMDKNLPISASIDEIRVKRSSVDDCFDYIVSTIDEAIVDLPSRVTNTLMLGRIDQTIAAAIKSRVLLYAASPLFNGNAEYYQNFKNVDGTPFFNATYDAEKWKFASDAAKEAIDLALENGISMFRFSGDIIEDDKTLIQYQSIQSLYHYRYMFTDKWNKELIWGNSQPVTGWYQIQAASLMKSPSVTSNEAAWQWLSPSMNIVESYYTENGLPIDEDITFDYENRYGMTTVGYANATEAQTGQQTAILHLNREPRFYSSIGFDRGYNRAYSDLFGLKIRKGETPGGRQGYSNDYLVTGYLLKKYSHMDSQGLDYGNSLIKYPWPIIRMAELYLNYAEALNEYNGPSQDVYNALNEIRSRVGLPNVEEVWSNPSLAKTLNKHQNKDGLRQIIHQERTIELAFEGHRYNDVRRLKQGDTYFNNPIQGWSVDEVEGDKFYQLKNIDERIFITPRDYFQPIPLNEITKNPNLVQNLGW